MTIDIAKKCAEEILEEYKGKIAEFGLVTKISHIYDTKNFESCEYDSPKLSIVSVNLEIRTKDMKDEDGIVFGICFEVDRNREVKDEEFEKLVSDERENLDDLVAALNGKDDVDTFIKEECKRINEESEAALNALSKKLARLDMITKWLMIAAGVVFCVLLVCVMFFN